MLIGLGFPTMFSSWIMECVTTTFYSLKINRDLMGFFKGKRGLRQGDLIPPFLFVISMEYLSRNLKSATKEIEFDFCPKCQSLDVSHRVYVDDLLLFSRGDLHSVSILKDAFLDFGKKVWSSS